MIEDLAARQRSEAAAAIQRRAKRQGDAAFWDGQGASNSGGNSIPVTTGSNGPLRLGQPTPLIQGGGSAQIDTFSAMRSVEPLIPVIQGLPFKTLAITPDQKLWLGGDRAPIEIATPTPPSTVVQLVNQGKSWAASWFIPAAGNQINFAPPKTLTPYNTSIVPIGFNYWIHPQVIAPGISFVVSGTGDVSRPSSLATSISLPTGDSGGLFYGSNLSATYAESAIATTNPKWAPYLVSTPIGAGTWTVATQYDGSRPTPIGQLAWQSFTQSQSINGIRPYKVAIFIYDPTKTNPITEFLGDATQETTGSATASMTRTANFDSINYSASSNKINKLIRSVQVLLIGGNGRTYSSEVLNDTTETITDVRSVNGSGCTANYNRQKIEKFKNFEQSPLNRILRTENCALVTERTFDSFLFERKTTETRSIASGTVTTVTRPGMRSPNLFAAPFILSASVVGGPLGGWFSGGSPTEGQAGLPAPQPTIYNKGHKLNAAEISHFGGQGYGGADRWFPDSFIGAMFDARGAYQDNSTNTTVYSEYTVVHAANPSEIWDSFLNYAADYALNYSRVITTEETRDYVDTKNHYLLSASASLPIPVGRAEIYARIPLNRISAPPTGHAGNLTFTGDGTFSLTIAQSTITREQSTITQTLTYASGVKTQDTTHTHRIYTGVALETFIGKKVELYKREGDVMTRYRGTLSSYSGVEQITPPAASGQTSPTSTFSNTFIGPYESRTSVRAMAIAVTESAIVSFCPWPIDSDSCTLVINPDHAILHDSVLAPGQFIEHPLAVKSCNIVGSGEKATLYVCNPALYKAGEKNYAAAWDIDATGIRMRSGFVSGKTKPDGTVAGTLLSVQYFSA